MALRNNAEEYGSAAKWLHWLIAVGIVVLLWLGLEEAGMERGAAKTAMRKTIVLISVLVPMSLCSVVCQRSQPR